MKALQIYQKLGSKLSGGIQVYNRNRSCLEHYFGEGNVYEYAVMRKGSRFSLKKLTGPLFGLYFCGLDKLDKIKIVQNIKDKHIDLVLVESSLFGSLIVYIKEQCPNVKVISFFHNVEYDFQKSELNCFKWLVLGWQNPFIKKSESITLQYSDASIALHRRDSERLLNLYGTQPAFEIPITLKDTQNNLIHSSEYHNPLRLLFFGSNFPANIKATDILVNEILPHVNVELRIAGSGMNRIMGRYNNDCVQIEGFVDNLGEMYEWADVVVLPIYTGAGMKVKVAEALQYGKNIISSTDALVGYDVDSIKGVISCNDVKGFIESINKFDVSLPRFNMSGRALYEKKYSYEASYKLFGEIFDKLIKQSR